MLLLLNRSRLCGGNKSTGVRSSGNNRWNRFIGLVEGSKEAGVHIDDACERIMERLHTRCIHSVGFILYLLVGRLVRLLSVAQALLSLGAARLAPHDLPLQLAVLAVLAVALLHLVVHAPEHPGVAAERRAHTLVVDGVGGERGVHAGERRAAHVGHLRTVLVEVPK